MVDDVRRRLEFARDNIKVRVNLGDSDWRSPISGGDRLLMVSDPAIRPGEESICLPPSSVVILEVSPARA
jgi:hypothetical protein